jgi:hypothetical protein
VKAYARTVPRIGIVVDLLQKEGVNAIGSGGVKNGCELATSSVDVVRDNFYGRAFAWEAEGGIKGVGGARSVTRGEVSFGGECVGAGALLLVWRSSERVGGVEWTEIACTTVDTGERCQRRGLPRGSANAG